jgi:hypothetical protein
LIDNYFSLTVNLFVQSNALIERLDISQSK